MTTSFGDLSFTSFELPSVQWHYIPTECCYKISDIRNKVFHTECALCGDRILVRGSEHPYCRKKGDRIAFLCKGCDPLFIDIGEDDGTPREFFKGYWDRKK